MYKQSFGFVYVINIVAQSIFTLLWQIALCVLAGWFFTKKCGAPDWVYVPLILLGVGVGLFSMIKFILTAMKNLEIIEKQNENDDKEDTLGGKG